MDGENTETPVFGRLDLVFPKFALDPHRWGIRPSLATALHKKKARKFCPKNPKFSCVHEQNADLLFALRLGAPSHHQERTWDLGF
jgi:hypothetical protein